MKPVEESFFAKVPPMVACIPSAEELKWCRWKSHMDDTRWGTLCDLISDGFPDGEIHEFGCHGAGTATYLSLRTGRRVFAWDRFKDGCSKPSEKDLNTANVEGFMSTDVSKICDVAGAEVVPIVYDLRDRPYPISLPIAFAVIDVNLYDPTIAALHETFKWLVPGGVVLVDDIQYPGVHTALEEFGWPWEGEGYMAILRKHSLAEGI